MLIFSVATLSIMLFYSIVIAANVHKTLDKDNAGKLLRVLFPSYLSHLVRRSRSVHDNLRISYAFNIENKTSLLK